MAMALSVTPISADCSDSDLVAAVRRGSDAAFEELYGRYSQRIGGYVRGMVGDHGRAEDVTQEIFISALRRMRDTERPIAFKPWIYEIARNACIDSYRRTRRAQEVSLDADDGLSQADRGRLTVITTPDSALDSKQAIENLRGAFGGLSEAHHEILVLRELEGLSYSDIGERLGMSRPVVESTLFRARRRLAEEYDELASGRRCAFVHKMVDSGPQYSLGIRDRRRIGRHLSHCQSCRAYARLGGFDASTLNLPSLTAGAAALLPLPFLWAWRSLHALARSSDAITVAMPSAGRGAATAAAILVAGVGGGVATVASQSGSTPSPAIQAPAPVAGLPFTREHGDPLLTTRGPMGWLGAGLLTRGPAGSNQPSAKHALPSAGASNVSHAGAQSTAGSGASGGGSSNAASGPTTAPPVPTGDAGPPATSGGGTDTGGTPGTSGGGGDGGSSQSNPKGSGGGETGHPPARPGGGSGTTKPGSNPTTPTSGGPQGGGGTTTTTTGSQPTTPTPPTPANAGNSGHPPQGLTNGMANGLKGTQPGQAPSTSASS